VKASSETSKSGHLICPVCEAGELHPFGGECAHRERCGYILGPAGRFGQACLRMRTPRDAFVARPGVPLHRLRFGNSCHRDPVRSQKNAPRIGFRGGRRSRSSSGHPYILTRLRSVEVGNGKATKCAREREAGARGREGDSADFGSLTRGRWHRRRRGLAEYQALRHRDAATAG
jgi:hypothetical protein